MAIKPNGNQTRTLFSATRNWTKRRRTVWHQMNWTTMVFEPNQTAIPRDCFNACQTCVPILDICHHRGTREVLANAYQNRCTAITVGWCTWFRAWQFHVWTIYHKTDEADPPNSASQTTSGVVQPSLHRSQHKVPILYNMCCDKCD